MWTDKLCATRQMNPETAEDIRLNKSIMYSTKFTFKVKTIVNYLLITLSSGGQLKTTTNLYHIEIKG